MVKMLLIEDEEFIRELYKRQLELEEFSIDAFANGTDGLKALQDNTYDMVLLDIMLPDISGIDILSQIKKNPNEAIKKTPVVMLTNLGDESVIKEAFKLGAVGYLLKATFTPHQMVAEVKNLLQQYKRTA